jgi:DNA topoisomerase-2
VITEAEDGINLNINMLKLQTSLATTNMVLFNEKNQLKKYSVDTIIDDFCILRFELYEKRKKKILEVLNADFKHISNKVRFILAIIEETFDIMNVPEQEIIRKLIEDGYDRDSLQVLEAGGGEEEASEIVGSKGYEYLLRLNVRNFTAEKVANLQKELLSIKDHIKKIETTNAKTMWLDDLNEFEVEYAKWLKVMNK